MSIPCPAVPAWVGNSESELSWGNQAQRYAVHPPLQPEAKFICVVAALKIFDDYHCIQVVFAFRVTQVVQLHKGPALSKGIPSMEVRRSDQKL